jgi:hypothetical protein
MQKPSNIATEEDTKTAQILVRISEEEREEWKRAAETGDISMSELIRTTVGSYVKTVLYCTHPAEFRQTYPWSSFCDKCGERLSG